MKITKYFIISLALVGSVYGVDYTQEQTRKVIEMLNFLQLNANCAQASAAILAAPNATLSQKEKDTMRAQIKFFAEKLVEYHSFLDDLKNTNHKRLEKMKELMQV